MKETKEIKKIDKESDVVLQHVQSIEVTTDDGLKHAVDELTNIKGISKRIQEEKEKLTKPAMEIVKWARLRFKPAEDSLEQAERVVKVKILGYNAKKAELARIEEAKIAKKVEQGKLKMETAIEKMGNVNRAETKTTGTIGQIVTRKVKKFEIMDSNLLPREYLVPDEVKIRKAVLAGITVPGVRVYEEEQLANTRL